MVRRWGAGSYEAGRVADENDFEPHSGARALAAGAAMFSE